MIVARAVFLASFFLALSLGALNAEDRPSASLQRILVKAQTFIENELPEKATAALLEWKKSDHSFRQLLLGQSYAMAEQDNLAIGAYEQALLLDPQYRDAALLLAEQYYLQQRWSVLCSLLGNWIDFQALTDSDKKILRLYAVAAYEDKDYRLAEQIVDNAIMRFPHEREFRNLDVQLLMQREMWKQAASEVSHLLRQKNPDQRLWQHLAFIQQQRDNNDEYVAAVEAGYILDPNNIMRIREHAQAQLSVGHNHEAFIHFTSLCAPVLASSAVLSEQEVELLRITMHAAQLVKDPAYAMRCLQRIPNAQRDQALRLQALRVHVETGQMEQANAAIEAIIASGNNQADVILWAAQIAEQIHKYPQAEIMYQLCRSKDTVETRRWRKIANVYLARLLSVQNRSVEAQIILQEHLQEWPTDAYAIKLQSMLVEGDNEQ